MLVVTYLSTVADIILIDPKTGLKAAGDLLLTAKTDAATPPTLTSGLLVTANVSEKFDLKSGDTLQPGSTTQDIILYRYPCITNIGAGATEPFDPTAGLEAPRGDVVIFISIDLDFTYVIFHACHD